MTVLGADFVCAFAVDRLLSVLLGTGRMKLPGSS